MKPILFLDIDGVLNAVKTPNSSWDDWFQLEATATGDRNYCRPGTYTLNLSKKMAQALAALDVDIVWLTSWFDSDIDHTIAQHLDLPSFPVMYPVRHKFSQWWKEAVIDAWREDNPDRPFIWLDDDAGNREYENALVISPNTSTGLYDTHIDTIKTWIANL